MEQNDKRNLFIAIILSTAIFLGWSYFYDKPRQQKLSEAHKVATTLNSQVPSPDNKLTVPGPAPILSLEQATTIDNRIKIETPTLKGSINLKGGKVDHLILTGYHETTEPNSSLITLLSPSQTQSPYFAEFGWVSSQKIALPDENTLWKTDKTTLTPENPVTLSWDNGQGLVFERQIMVDKDYLFSITQRVINKTNNSVTLHSYGLISRHGTPKTSGFIVLHEGPLAYLNDKLIEKDYKDLQKHPLETAQSKGGWIGITDKYWLTALIPAQNEAVKVSFRDTPIKNAAETIDQYQVDFLSSAQIAEPGKTIETKNHFFAGAKVLDLLDHYEEVLGIKHFDLAVDFGWFYFLTKPLFYFLTYLHNLLGNFGLAIILLTILLKIAFFPLANKSFRSMARMKRLQPQITRLRERYENDKLKLNQEIMELYKKEKANPLSGCLPLLIQIPVFFALYKVLFISIEMRHAPFYGWIHDLAAPDPTSLFNLFGLIPWAPPSFLMIGAWPILMGVTMFIQQKMSPPPADPAQAKIFMLLPIMFTFMLASFPSGLVIYWALNNIITILQQWVLMRLDERRSHS
jgi:YidC/Oxa1 family membrane protein insertase